MHPAGYRAVGALLHDAFPDANADPTQESVPTDSVTPGPTGVLPDYWGVTVQAQE